MKITIYPKKTKVIRKTPIYVLNSILGKNWVKDYERVYLDKNSNTATATNGKFLIQIPYNTERSGFLSKNGDFENREKKEFITIFDSFEYIDNVKISLKNLYYYLVAAQEKIINEDYKDICVRFEFPYYSGFFSVNHLIKIVKSLIKIGEDYVSFFYKKKCKPEDNHIKIIGEKSKSLISGYYNEYDEIIFFTLKHKL